jgi:hypothetical protein
MKGGVAAGPGAWGLVQMPAAGQSLLPGGPRAEGLPRKKTRVLSDRLLLMQDRQIRRMIYARLRQG